MRVAIAWGGNRSEADISRRSADAVFQAARQLGHQPVLIPLEDLGRELMSDRPDVVFNACHGAPGESGAVATIAEMFKVPYTGSAASPSALAMNKFACLSLWGRCGLPVLDGRLVTSIEEAQQACQAFGGTAFIKPNCGGSSVGMSIAGRNHAPIDEAFDMAAKHGDVLAECVADGRECTVAIIDNCPLQPLWISAANAFYDYDAKYSRRDTQYVPVTESSVIIQAQRVALEAHRLIGLRHWSRVDLIVHNDALHLLEINATPGMTAQSLVPKAALLRGWSFEDVIDKLISLAVGDCLDA